MSFAINWALLSFVIVSTVTPGPNNLMLMASGMNFGYRRSLPHMLGIAVGFMVLNLVVSLALGQIIFEYKSLYYGLLAISFCFVLWLAWKIANSGPVDASGDTGKASATPITFLQAAAFQWVNPKAWAMAAAAAAAYLDEENKLWSALVIAGTFGIVNFPSGTCWTSFGISLRRLFSRPKTLRITNMIMAILLVASFGLVFI